MQFVGADDLLGHLRDHAVLRRQQLGADRGCKNVEEGIRKRGFARVAVGLGAAAHDVAHQRLRHRGVHAVHRHVVAVVGGKAERQLGEVARADHDAALFVGKIHQDLRALARLAVFIGHVMRLGVLPDVAEVDVHRVLDVDVREGRAKRGGKRLRIGFGALRRAEAGHRHGVNVGQGSTRNFAGAHGDQQGKAGVKTAVGPEQEYFLIDKSAFDKRKDLIYTGRTLFGAKAPKGQELDDHYFGAIKPRVAAFMKELNDELWKLGVLAKTEHNEVAPAQHEMAPIFTATNIAADHNQLTMEMMRKVAQRHGLVCLLHEKPFDGVNGSGKHNNWSISTDTGVNLLEPGETPYENAQFLLFLCAVIKAVDEYQDLLRISVASAGNDHRLGANEAPPAIVSMFLGSDLSEILEAIEKDAPYDGKEKEVLRIGVHTLPKFQRDATDRNRTSPFAFTGNKFEFRMLGSAESISCTNTILNTTVAEELRQFADKLEGAENFENALHDLIRQTIIDHKRIIFNGDGYDASWVKEAEKRGLLNLKTTPDALAHMLDRKNIELFKTHKVYSEAELTARHEVKLENYSKIINIEATTMLDMTWKDILPAVSDYTGSLAQRAKAKKASLSDMDCSYEEDLGRKLSALEASAYRAAGKLEKDLLSTKAAPDAAALADIFKTTILDDMRELRIAVDSMETIMPSEKWPYPSYGQILFDVR